MHPTVLLTKIAAGSYPNHSNVSIANRVSLAERRGLEPLRRCRRSRISNPAPYLLGQRSVWTSFGTSERGVEGSVRYRPAFTAWRRQPYCQPCYLLVAQYMDKAAILRFKNQHRRGHRHLKTPRRVLFGLHSATRDAAAYRRWAMELAPTVRFEHTGPFGRRFSGPCRYRYGLHRRMAGNTGVEPVTTRLTAECSTF